MFMLVFETIATKDTLENYSASASAAGVFALNNRT
jgi:hypothetical protein